MCNHRWIKKQYNGLSVIATWSVCASCGTEKDRQVKER